MNDRLVSEPEIHSGITNDDKGFITYFGNIPVYRSFKYDPAYDAFYMLKYAGSFKTSINQ